MPRNKKHRVESTLRSIETLENRELFNVDFGFFAPATSFAPAVQVADFGNSANSSVTKGIVSSRAIALSPSRVELAFSGGWSTSIADWEDWGI